MNVNDINIISQLIYFVNMLSIIDTILFGCKILILGAFLALVIFICSRAYFSGKYKYNNKK